MTDCDIDIIVTDKHPACLRAIAPVGTTLSVIYDTEEVERTEHIDCERSSRCSSGTYSRSYAERVVTAIACAFIVGADDEATEIELSDDVSDALHAIVSDAVGGAI